MRWVQFGCLILIIGCAASKEESNEFKLPPPPVNLDSNLRRALLKALTELENEDNSKNANQQTNLADKIVTKASASAVSIYTTDAKSSTENYIQTTTEKKNNDILFQKSNSIQHKPITTFENAEVIDAEQFLTSASNSFATSNKILHEKSESVKNFANEQNANTLTVDIKPTTPRPVRQEVTTVTTTTSTEESEAKVEDVQFFSAPLVAAFTVHQDENGLPKHVEPIYKPQPTIRKPSVAEQKALAQAKLRQEEIIKQQILEQQRIRNQLVLQQKQQTLEDEIRRLKLIQQQQDLYLRQQYQKEKLLEEEIRLRNNGLPFQPLVNTATNKLQNTAKQNKVETPTTKVNDNISFQPSLAFDPLVEAGKLPLNAQILPVRNAIDFRSPIIQSPGFQQYHSISQQNLPNSFNAEPTANFAPQNTRVFRQEASTGNFVSNNNFAPAITIQKSVQPPPQQNSFFNNNFQSFPSYSITPSIQQESNFQPPQQNRFFRSNLEGTFSSPNNFNRLQPQVVNRHLNNLLYNSGIIRGNEQEHLGIVSKVLSFNHDNLFASSNAVPSRVLAPPLKKV